MSIQIADRVTSSRLSAPGYYKTMSRLNLREGNLTLTGCMYCGTMLAYTLLLLGLSLYMQPALLDNTGYSDRINCVDITRYLAHSELHEGSGTSPLA